MKKYRITLLSMLVISSVFCISLLFSIQFPINASTMEDDSKLAIEAKITEEASEEAIVSLFSYSTDDDELYNDNYITADYRTEEQTADVGLMAIQSYESEPVDATDNAEAANSTDDTNDTNSTNGADNTGDISLAEDADNTESGSNSPEYRKYEDSQEEQCKAAFNYLEALEAAREVAKSKYFNIGISIAKEFVNIRKKATTESESLGKLYRNSACTIIEEQDGWYYVESGGITGYVKAEYIKTGIPDEELIQKYGTQKVIVTVDGLNVRKEPSTDSKRLTVIYKNEKYPITQTIDGWYKIKVEDENIEGYVKAEHTELDVTFKEAVSKKEEERLAELKAEERAKKETAVKYRDDVNYTSDELKLLACLVHAEAGTQGYEGKLAVANVVINRMKSSKYPNSMKEVIYQSGQFSVARSGSLQKQLDNYANYKSTSQKMSIKAAKDALEGANNIGNRLYFQSYKAAVKKGYHKKPNSVKIEDHLFW